MDNYYYNNQNQTNKSTKFIIGGLGLVILAAGLFAGIFLVQSRQTVKTKAAPIQLNIEISAPRNTSKVLGITNVYATVDQNSDPATLRAVFNIDGKDATELKIDKLDNKLSLVGKWDSSKYPVGTHSFEIFLYQNSDPPTLLGSNKITVTVIAP